MWSYYKYKDVSNVYNASDIINIELNCEYNYNSHVVLNSKMQKYLEEIMLFHIGNNENDNKITYSRINYEELLDATINDKDDTNSIIVNLSNEPLTMITVDMNADNYMFKECQDETIMNIIIVEPKSHIFFDNLTVYGFINYDFTKNEFIDSKSLNSNIYLKIDIPKACVNLNKNSQTDTPWLEYSEKHYITQYNNSVETIENIIYDTTKSNIISIINDKYKDTNALIINLKFVIDTEVCNKENVYKYGNIYNEIIKLKNDQLNKFNTNKLVLHALPPLICNWIFNECQYIDHYNELKYNNFDKTITIEEIPNILHFCLFSTMTHIQYFKQLYNIPDNLPINIIDMFISNNNDSQSKYNSKQENTYIVLNYKLTTDKGYIKFIDSIDDVIQNQGDLLIYTSKKEQHKCETNDTWYSLIVLLDIITINEMAN